MYIQRQGRFLQEPVLNLGWLTEPLLVFADGHTHVDPRIGVPLYGPRSLHTPRHKSEVHVGFVGEPDAIEYVKRFVQECAGGVTAEDVDNGSMHFPGISRDIGYRFEIIVSDDLIAKITKTEKEKVLGARARRDRFHGMLDVIEEKVNYLYDKDYPLDYIFIVLTEDLYSELRVVETPDPISGKGRAQRNFRRALKARLMKYRIPTQIIRESTTGYVGGRRDLQDMATRAWNLFTAMYYKVGGLPWGPTEIDSATCFVGISFYRPYGEPSYMRASVAQAFNERGEGLVLRGQKFRWDDRMGKSPHMPEKLAKQLIEQVLQLYRAENGHSPRRVVIHKTSRFAPEEREGFKRALDGIPEYDLVTVGVTSTFRLFRVGRYPPLRGAVMRIGDNFILYTTGYLTYLQKYPHGHVPAPLRIVDHFGDTAKTQLLREIFVLTKMNWNTASVDGAHPITLRFARLVGDILKEIPEEEVPNPKYIYYM